MTSSVSEDVSLSETAYRSVCIVWIRLVKHLQVLQLNNKHEVRRQLIRKDREKPGELILWETHTPLHTEQSKIRLIAWKVMVVISIYGVHSF